MEFAGLTLAELPLRTLREVSAMATEVVRASGASPPDYRAAIDVVVNSPRTPFLGVFLVAIAVCLMVLDPAA